MVFQVWHIRLQRVKVGIRLLSLPQGKLVLDIIGDLIMPVTNRFFMQKEGLMGYVQKVTTTISLAGLGACAGMMSESMFEKAYLKNCHLPGVVDMEVLKYLPEGSSLSGGKGFCNIYLLFGICGFLLGGVIDLMRHYSARTGPVN